MWPERATWTRPVAHSGDMPKHARWAMMSNLDPNRSPRMPQPTLAPRRSAAIRVAVVEDDAACRQSLVQALQTAPDMQLAWQAAARAPALALLPTEALDVLLVDLGLPDGSGLEVIAAARQQIAKQRFSVVGIQVAQLNACMIDRNVSLAPLMAAHQQLGARCDQQNDRRTAEPSGNRGHQL